MQPLFSLPPIELYTIAWIASSAGYLIFAFWLNRTPVTRTLVWVLLAFGILLRIAVLPVRPSGSDDIYRYIWDGKVQSSGINPYRYPPDAPELAGLHTADLPARVNHPSMKTLYFPFAQWAFCLGFQISGDDTRGIKLLLFAAEMGTLVMLLLLLRWAGIPDRFVLLYALCPLPIFQFALDGHIDALGLPFLLGAIAFWIRQKKTASLLLLGLSVSVKPVGLILLPLLVLQEKGIAARLQVITIPFLPLVAQFLPYVFSANPFESIVTFGMHWTFNGAIFEVVNAIMANNQVSRLACAVLLGAGVMTFALRRGHIVERSYSTVLLLLLLSPVVHPWYVSWLAVFIPLVRRWSGILFVTTVSLTALTVLEYRLTGPWMQHPWVLVAEYLPVLTAFLYEQRTAPELAWQRNSI